jgi:hypothetical protein
MFFVSLSFVYTRPTESTVGDIFTRPGSPSASTTAAGHTKFVRGILSDYVMAMLGPNLTQEHFRLVVYSATALAFEASGEEPLTCGEFVARYDVVHPNDQPGLSDDPVAAHVGSLQRSYVTPGDASAAHCDHPPQVGG